MFEFIQNIDFIILNFIHNNLTSPFLDGVMTFITTLGNSGAIWIIITVLMLFSKKYKKTGIMMTIGLVLCMLIGNVFLKPYVARLRPFQIAEGINLIIKTPHDFSFPSGHTYSSILSGVIIFTRHRKEGIYALLLAILISFSRLYLYVHFPSDVIAGATLGVLTAIFSIKLTLYLFHNEKIS